MICFCWSGFPQYAARCVGAFVKSSGRKCVVVATRPKVPVEGMEHLCRCPVYWINEDDVVDIKSLVGEVPSIAIISGWGFKSFCTIADTVRKRGGKACAMVDNNFIFSIKEFLRSIKFRLFIRKRFDAFFVPGTSGQSLMRFYGVAENKVFDGLYAADSTLFVSKVPILEREKKIIFVGQLCDRKNIVSFAKAFLDIDLHKRDGWKLEICGCGPDKDRIPQSDCITLHDFVQPESLPDLYQQSRIFALPSKEEHWGLVVHEAALSGCLLLLSSQVGASHDFVGEMNGFLFNAFSKNDMRIAIEHCLNYTDTQLVKAQQESLQKAARISIEKFASSCSSMIDSILSK